jgi:hypothetical protein
MFVAPKTGAKDLLCPLVDATHKFKVPSITCDSVAKPTVAARIRYHRSDSLDHKISPKLCRLGTMDWFDDRTIPHELVLVENRSISV